MHGTTSGLTKSHGLILMSSDNDVRCIGLTRSALLTFQANHSGRYFSVVLICLAPTGSSLLRIVTLTSSHQCVLIWYGMYPSKYLAFCQAFLKKRNSNHSFYFMEYVSISSALFNVVSVIFAPPIIRANSRFLPSKSKGVTEV